MPTELKVPEVGESVTEVEIGRWLVKEGDAVNADQPVVELETDKVNQELPAPVNGAIVKFLLKEGDTARVGDVIAHIEEGAKGNASTNGTAPAPAEAASAAGEPAPHADAERSEASGSPRIMPAAQLLLDEHKLNAADVKATGPGGRLLKEDVLAHLDNKQAPTPQAAPERSEGADRPAATASTPSTTSGGDRPEEVVRMSPLRRTIAKALVNAQQTAALLTTFNEVDMTAVM
ncbi:MAG: biotin/lipoyl-containing protein, partial [Planctomycetota bacterium]